MEPVSGRARRKAGAALTMWRRNGRGPSAKGEVCEDSLPATAAVVPAVGGSKERSPSPAPVPYTGYAGLST